MTIFISYAREDFEIAERLYNDLSKSGLKPWMDNKDIIAGQNWKITIINAIKESSYFIALLSSNSVSKRGFVQKELKLALNILDEFPRNQIFIIPVRIDNSKPHDITLHELQWVDLFPSYENGFNEILRAILPKNNNNLKNYLLDKHIIPIDKLSIFISDSANKIDNTGKSYYWDKDGNMKSIKNPLHDNYKVESIIDLDNYRFLALFLIPRINKETNATELLFKKHKEWKNVFPSLEINRKIKHLDDINNEVKIRSKEVIYIGDINDCVYAGGLISFKKSPTYYEKNCYLFLFYILNVNIEDYQLNIYREGGKNFHFLSKENAQAYIDKIEVPNLDVLITLERLYSSWGVFRKYVSN